MKGQTGMSTGTRDMSGTLIDSAQCSVKMLEKGGRAGPQDEHIIEPQCCVGPNGLLNVQAIFIFPCLANRYLQRQGDPVSSLSKFAGRSRRSCRMWFGPITSKASSIVIAVLNISFQNPASGPSSTSSDGHVRRWPVNNSDCQDTQTAACSPFSEPTILCLFGYSQGALRMFVLRPLQNQRMHACGAFDVRELL